MLGSYIRLGAFCIVLERSSDPGEVEGADVPVALVVPFWRPAPEKLKKIVRYVVIIDWLILLTNQVFVSTRAKCTSRVFPRPTSYTRVSQAFLISFLSFSSVNQSAGARNIFLKVPRGRTIILPTAKHHSMVF